MNQNRPPFMPRTPTPLPAFDRLRPTRRVAAASVDLRSNLEGYYRFTDLTDSSGNGRNMTIEAGSTEEHSAGILGNCLGGVTPLRDSSAEVTNNAVSGSLGTISATIGGWFKSNTVAVGAPVGFGITNTAYDSYRFFVGLYSPTLSEPILAVGYINNTDYSYGTSTTRNVWYHLAMTASGGVAKFYVNGTLVNTSAYTSSQSTGNTDDIYVHIEASSRHWADECFIYSRALNAAEIAALYNSGSGLDPTA